jgi:hypothetical protein
MRALYTIALLATACSEYDLKGASDTPEGWDEEWTDEPTDGAAQIQVVPDPFDFGTLATACSAGSFPFFVRNVGDADLDVLEFTLDDGNEGLVLDVPTAPLTLGPGEWIDGMASWMPDFDGEPGGVFGVRSTDSAAPLIERPLQGTACGDMDTDGICDDVDTDRDGDGISNDVDEYPDHHVIENVLIDFDDLAPGTRVTDQYSYLGITLEGSGAPGEGGDSNVVGLGSDHTTASLHTPSNVLATWVNDGFNHDGSPGLSGTLDIAAQVVTLRFYTAGIEYAEAAGGEQDSGTLYTYAADGTLVGSSTTSVDTNAGIESEVVEVLGGAIREFDLYTGDFDALDDLRILRLEAPECGEPLP